MQFRTTAKENCEISKLLDGYSLENACALTHIFNFISRVFFQFNEHVLEGLKVRNQVNLALILACSSTFTPKLRIYRTLLKMHYCNRFI